MASLCLHVASILLANAESAPWMHPPESPALDSDMTDKQRQERARVDPGVEGSIDMIGSAMTNFEARLQKEGADAMNAKTLGPEEWSKMHGITLLSQPFNYYGTQVVNTSLGIQPASQIVYTAGYELEERPRRVALLIMDIMIDYIPFVGYLIPQAKQVFDAFRDRDLPVFWSNYLRRSNDGLYGALDRFYGPKGVTSMLNPMYVYAKDGGQTVPELAPTEKDIEEGRVIQSSHLNKFADVDKYGRSIFAMELQKLGVDTLVIVGAWTEDCVFSTVAEAVDKLNIDVVLPREAVGTATPDHFPGMELMESGWAKVVSVKQMEKYLTSAPSSDLWNPHVQLGQIVPSVLSASVLELSQDRSWLPTWHILGIAMISALLGAAMMHGYHVKIAAKKTDPLLEQLRESMA